MRQLAAYIKEREGFDSIVLEEGFISYKIFGEECYIRDIWADPDYRYKGVGTDLANRVTEIARAKGCKYLSGSVDPSKGDPTASTKALFAYGFKVFAAAQSAIWFRKDI